MDMTLVIDIVKSIRKGAFLLLEKGGSYDHEQIGTGHFICGIRG